MTKEKKIKIEEEKVIISNDIDLGATISYQDKK